MLAESLSHRCGRLPQFRRKDPMAEAVVVSPAVSIERRVSQDRLFYSGMAIIMALAVLAGFAQTYYLPLTGRA